MAKRRKSSNRQLSAVGGTGPIMVSSALLDEVRDLIRQTRENIAQAVNSALVLLYWQIGYRIRKEILKDGRAPYGDEILSTLSNKLAGEFGNGFSQPNLSRMMRFAEAFSNREVVTTLARQLSWSHFVEIIPLKDDLQRDFYAELCRVERWSVRTLHSRIQSMLFERTALSRKPAELARQELTTLRDEDKLTPDLVFRDPYLLNFLGLADIYSERDFETAILREVERFILELGAGFAFIARQKRLAIDGKDHRLDLLFYHRHLKRLVCIDLKIGSFEAADKGQMELYLRWLEKHEMQPGEEAPIGLILCEDKGEEQIELLQLDRSGIRVASYLTDLPPRPLLQKKLHDAAQIARARLETANESPKRQTSSKKRQTHNS